MNDYELNMAIAELIYPDSTVKKDDETESGIYVIQKTVGYLFRDYCNDWNDLMPLVVEHGIHVAKYITWWGAYTCDTKPEGENGCLGYAQTTKRAYAECLLKVLISKNKEE